MYWIEQIGPPNGNRVSRPRLVPNGLYWPKAIMHNRNARLVGGLAGHLAMGMVLGLFLAVGLIAGNFAGVRVMLAHSAAPRLDLALFIAVWSLLIGVGSACTGFIFIAVERERRR